MSHSQLAAEFAAGNEQVTALLYGRLSFKQAMKPAKVKILGCMDDGTDEALSRAAGSLILLPLDDAVRIVEEMKRELGLELIGYHGSEDDGGCGAAAKYLHDIRHIESPTLEQIIEIAKWSSERLAKKTGLKAMEMVLDRSHHHVARAVYYDGTGKMTSTKGLPRGFVVSRRFLPRHYAQVEVATAVSIAMAHGYGDLFCDPHPIALVAIGKDGNQTAELREELEHSLTLMTEQERAIVRIVSVAA